MDGAIKLTVNGQEHELHLPAETPLLYVLRNDLCLNGPKYGCGLGECGACSVLIEGRCARACVLPLGAVAGKKITTLEGLGDRNALHPVQQAFLQAQAAQCGYCLNGMVMATVGLLAAHPQPSEQEIRDGMANNLCRCGTHIEILQAVRLAAKLVQEQGQ